MKRSRRRTTWIAGVAAAAGLAIGLIVGLTVFIDQQPDNSSQSSSSSQASPRASQTTSTGSAPKNEGPIAVSAEIVNTNPREGWLLMIDEDLAQSRPPVNVMNCHQLFAWALSQGAMPAFVAEHVLTIRASRDVYVRIVGLEVRQQTEQAEARPKTPVRLGCQSGDDQATPTSTPKERLPKMETVPIGHVPTEEDTGYFEEFRLAAGEVVQERFLVEPLWGPGQYDYVISARIQVDGQESTFKLDAGGGRPFRWNEDGGGAGYWPASYTWRFSPEPTYIHCLPGNETENKIPDCREEKPR